MRYLKQIFLLIILASNFDVVAQDTTWVQTFTWEDQNNPETAYDYPGRRWFEFPASENGEEYRKVLMYYNLKCFEDGTAGNLGYPCGEWDYLTYNYLFEHTGILDSSGLEVINRFELGRFITPYGINLTLGPDGWTWIFDVTDYLPLLRDSVELEAGNWQELLDMKFAFIHGTIPRDVVDLDAFWKGSFELNSWDDNVLPYEHQAVEGAEMFKLITRASGHGFGTGSNCGEFCNNTHSVKVNGVEHWSWEIMQECADNPLYPQGGTWMFDRAGWCPGNKVTQQEMELTDYVDDEFTVEYDITHDPNGTYSMEGQIISYGSPNMTHDVELMDILAPNNRKVLSRWNPVCEDPIALIRNNGTTPLYECTFTYGIEGGETQMYTWTSESPLEFLETQEVSLPYDDPGYTEGGDGESLTFMISVDMDGDQEDSNGLGYSKFERVPTYSNNDLNDDRFIVWVKTNQMPQESSAEITNSDGSVVWSREYYNPNTNYRDTLELNTGCYRFNLLDSDDDGLSFWANNDGDGFARLTKVSGENVYAIEEDFGKYISHAFRFESNLNSEEEEEEQESISENSCSELFISEYVEGNGNNKAIEFYNPTSDYIELDGYTLTRYGNGSTAPSDSAQLWGTVAPYSTWVLVNGQTEDFNDGTFIYPACDPILQSLADQLDSDSYPAPTYFNGDDALVLTRYGEVIDIFGKVGEDPGSAWTDDSEAGFTDYNGGSWLTNNQTLQRKYAVSEGVTSNPLLFDTSLEWDTLPIETWDGLGYHDCYCNELYEDAFNMCEIDFDFGDVEFGISPNSEAGESLEDGYLGSEYYETIHFLFPSSVNYLDPTFPNIPLDSSRVESIYYYESGDPANIYSDDQIGLDLICNNNEDLEESCYFLGDNQYCLALQGLPNISGDFEVIIVFEGYVSLFGTVINSQFQLPPFSLIIHEEEVIEGCTDEMACNYNSEANFDNGSCEYEWCYGCLDSEAVNYSEDAWYDDGSCDYLDLNCENIGEESWAIVESGIYPATSSATFGVNSSTEIVLHVNNMILDPITGQEYAFVNFDLTNIEGLPLGIESNIAQTQITPIDQVCFTLQGIPYEFGIFNIQFTGVAVISLFGLELELNNYSFSHLLIINENQNPVLGCTYFGAINYSPQANIDNGSCEIDGCTDPLALNYNPLFTVEDGSCVYNTSDSECITDINDDGVITIEDLLTLLEDFGQQCE